MDFDFVPLIANFVDEEIEAKLDFEIQSKRAQIDIYNSEIAFHEVQIATTDGNCAELALELEMLKIK